MLDTSIVIALEQLDAQTLPQDAAISAATLAELTAGQHATPDGVERARRQDRLKRVEAHFGPIPVEVNVARA